MTDVFLTKLTQAAARTLSNLCKVSDGLVWLHPKTHSYVLTAQSASLVPTYVHKRCVWYE